MSDLTLDALRAEFRSSFSEPAVADEGAMREFLVIEAGRQVVAAALESVGGLFKDRRPQPAPGAAAGFIGMVELRGTIAPVYALADLLGGRQEGPPRWLLTPRGDETLALGFDRLIDCAAVRPEAVLPSAAGPGALAFAGATIPIIDFAALTAAITVRDPDQES